MKKYLYIFKSELMSNISYTFDMLLGFVGYIIMIFILMTLWQYIYSDPIRKTGSAQSVDIRISDFATDENYNWKEDDTILLCVRVSSLSGETSIDWSKPSSFHIVKKPTVNIDVDNTSVHDINIPSGMTDDTVPASRSFLFGSIVATVTSDDKRSCILLLLSNKN